MNIRPRRVDFSESGIPGNPDLRLVAFTAPLCPPLLAVRHLCTTLRGPRKTLFPVDDVTFSIARGETLGLVEESGSGKTMPARSILKLLPPPVGLTGEVLLAGEDLVRLSEKKMRQTRGRRIAMMFQHPSARFNPLSRVGDQLVETIQVYRIGSREHAWQRGVELLEAVRPRACPFHPCCPEVEDRCRQEAPRLLPIENDQWVRCFRREGPGRRGAQGVDEDP